VVCPPGGSEADLSVVTVRGTRGEAILGAYARPTPLNRAPSQAASNPPPRHAAENIYRVIMMMLASASHTVHKHADGRPQAQTQPGTGAGPDGEGS